MILGILQCGEVSSEFQQEFGDYPAMIKNMLTDMMPDDTSFVTYRIPDGEIPNEVDECDAYITTGSRFGVNDGFEWIDKLSDFILQLNQAKKKLVGICFGHQLIAKALGGRVKLMDWRIGVAFNQLTQVCRWMEPSLEKLDIIVSHKDQVVEIPAGAVVLASSSFCQYFMLQYGENFLSIQGHPEFSREYSRTLSHSRIDIIGANSVEEADYSLQSPVDDKVTARWLANFLSF